MTWRAYVKYWRAAGIPCAKLAYFSARKETRPLLNNKNKKRAFYFVLSSICLLFPCGEKTGGISTIKTKSELFILYCLRFAYFSLAGEDRLHLNNKNKKRAFYFVLSSICAIFADVKF